MTSEMRATNGKNGACGTPNTATTHPNGRPTIKLLTNSEGHILIVGVALTVSFLLWLAYKAFASPEEFPALVSMTTLTAVAGRAYGILFGYSVNLSYLMVLWISAVAETAVVLIFYPLFVFSCQHLLVIKPLQKAFDRVLRTAETHKTLIRRYGPIGVFAFVLFPFWATGPVVGSVIGFLMRIPVWLNMATVLTATYVAIAIWACLLRRVHDHMSSYSHYAALILLVVLIVFGVVSHAAYTAIRNRRHKT